MRRIAAVVAIVIGVALVVMPFAESLFSRSKSAERLADSVRPAMTQKALASDRSGFDVVQAAVTEFNGPARPKLARALGQSPQQFDSYLHKSFPAIATGSRALPVGFLPHSNLILTTLEKNRTRFETADSFPLSGVSPRIGPWIFLALGVGLIVIGVVVAVTAGPAPLAILALLGLVPLAFALAATLPHKAASTDTLVDRLTPAFTVQSAGRVPAEVVTAQRFVRQLEGGLLPALDRKLNLSPSQRDAFLRQNAPALARALPQFNGIIGTFSTLGAALVADRHYYLETAKIPTRTLVWLMIAASAIVLLVSLIALLAVRREPAPAAVAASP